MLTGICILHACGWNWTALYYICILQLNETKMLSIERNGETNMRCQNENAFEWMKCGNAARFTRFQNKWLFPLEEMQKRNNAFIRFQRRKRSPVDETQNHNNALTTYQWLLIVKKKNAPAQTKLETQSTENSLSNQ